jgi:hypothetical protein
VRRRSEPSAKAQVHAQLPALRVVGILDQKSLPSQLRLILNRILYLV